MKMTKEQFLKMHGVTDEQLKRMNLLIRPCRCNRSYCSGWQIEDIHRTDLAVETFMAVGGTENDNEN